LLQFITLDEGTQIMTRQEKSFGYYNGFDYLRILFALFIVAWHIQLLGRDNLFSPMLGTNFIPSLADILYCNVFLVAVPLFFLLSLFLYIINRNSKNNYFVNRTKRIIFLYTFWTLASLALLQDGITLQNLLSVKTIISGGYSVTYFLFEIIIMTTVLEVILQLKLRIKPSHFNILIAFLLGVSCILLAIMPLLSGLFDPRLKFLFLLYYSPLNFLPYPFLAVILYELHKKRNKIFNLNQMLLLFFAMVLSIIVEWKTLPSNELLIADYFLLPQNSRISLLFASVLLLVFFINFNVNGGILIKNLSEMTLGVFLLHYFLIPYYSTITPGLAVYTSNKMPLHYAVIVGMSFVLTYCLKKFKVV
jgi:hypothetical protein